MSYGFEYNDRGFGGGFDAMGGFGGGFDMGGGGFMAEEKGAKSSEKKSRDKQTLLAISCHQLLNAANHDDTYKIDDVEIHTVKLVGIFSQPQEHSTNFIFRLNDGSGSVECKMWLDKENNMLGKLNSVKPGSMVKVFGSVREFDGKLHVSVFDVSPIIDWNEVTYHTLEVIHTHLYNTRGAAQSHSSTAPAVSGFGSTAMHSTPVANRGGFGQSLNNVKKEQQNLNEVVFNAYMQGSVGLQTGLHNQEVLQILKRQGHSITLDQLIRTVQQLCEDGRLYTTIDDEHYKPTQADY